ncbi:metalloregulator ArsR/SmtB family transcription factor [Kangiella shandongensis]|uniref:metalloregulator ArsR/SmtB family transcription factor n=1 Tax=Kangiella shandongensis TaxID=2763258 RepID=UPI001CBDCD05|nr:metalloregulator ArsR/SmtB family transcription factor [Kangiella shandongensis]
MQATQFFKCLSDETRLKTILLILHEEELCVCELTEALKESQPKVSRHLAQLKNLSLLEARRQSQWMYYRLNRELPEWTLSVLETTLKAQKDSIQQYLDNLCCMGDRPVRVANCCD